MTQLDEAYIEVDGHRIEGWTSYRIASNLLVPADAFSMTFGVGGKLHKTDVEDARTALLNLLSPGKRIRVVVGKASPSPQMIGIIDTREVKSDNDGGFSIQIRGRDNAGPLVDSSVGIRIKVENDRLVSRVVKGEVVEVDGVDAVTGASQPDRRAVFELPEAGAALDQFIAKTTAQNVARLTQPPKVKIFKPDTVVKESVTEQARFIDVIRTAVAPWGVPVIAESVTARGLLTGTAVRQPRSRLDRELDRQMGLPTGTNSRAVQRRSRRSGLPVDEIVGAVPSEAARNRSQNGYVPGDIERIKAKDARPRAGETVWDFIHRHAQRFGLMLWMSPRGELIVNAPSYNQQPLYRLVRRLRNDPNDPNNILSGTRVDDFADRFSSVTVYGRARGGDVRRARISATVVDEDAPYLKPLIIHDQSVRTEEQAKRRANMELTKRKTRAVKLDYTVPGHGQIYIEGSGDATVLYSIDTIATIHDEVTGTFGDYYVAAREFQKDSSGTRTTLSLLPKGAIYLRGE